MIKGDRIRLKAKMGVFDNIGEVCEVTDISDGGVICFKFGNGSHLGCMSFDEYEKYFELVEEEKEPVKRVWSRWKLGYIIFYNPNRECIEKESLRANASCCKEDEFDLSKGRELAEKRLIVKYLAREVKEYADSL